MNTIKLLIICLLLTGTVISKAQEQELHLNPPQIIKNPYSHEMYSTENRKFTGIPSLAVSPGGRKWCVWYAGPSAGEDLNNYVVLSTSDDRGDTWKEVLVIDPDGPGKVRAYDPEIWIDPHGKLWVFWAQAKAHKDGTWALVSEGTSAGVWALKIDDPESVDPVWSPPFRITDGVMMCKPTVLTNGEWTLPVSMWKKEPQHARMVVSENKGRTWNVRGGASVPDSARSFDENSIVERKDGSLWMLIRTKYGIGESISTDRGFTWSPVIPSEILHPAARFFISRLNSGNLLLVKHGPVDVKTGRSHLMAFISKDDGNTWTNGLLLDERKGVSYPDGQQLQDGTIFIVYDYNRTTDQNILLTSFSEDDILAGTDKKIIEVYRRRTIISKGRMK